MKHIVCLAADFFGSLTGWLTTILVVGMTISASTALLAMEMGRQVEFQHIHQARVLASAVDLASRLQNDTDETLKSLDSNAFVGAKLIPLSNGSIRGDEDYTQALISRIGAKGNPQLINVPSGYCTRDDPFWSKSRAAGMKDLRPPECWLLATATSKGRISIGIPLPPLPTPPSAITSPFFLSLVIVGSLILSYLTARLVTAPLQRLTQAADAFARSIDAPPVAETGPSDVRAALTTFNLMQERVREGLRERTRILAAVSHDLQTPLTRLRLRLEQVEDDTLRHRLISDLSATLSMVKRGLDLARSGESGEEWVVVNLNSLLLSLADDANECGQAVCFFDGPQLRVRVRPDALKRCLMNLLDNATKYGGSADISCVQVEKDIIVSIRDHGPGLSDELLRRVFEPFVRGGSGKSSGDGTGIGLTIAKAQAGAIGGRVALTNHPDGGAVASLTLPVYSGRGI